MNRCKRESNIQKRVNKRSANRRFIESRKKLSVAVESATPPALLAAFKGWLEPDEYEKCFELAFIITSQAPKIARYSNPHHFPRELHDFVFSSQNASHVQNLMESVAITDVLTGDGAPAHELPPDWLKPALLLTRYVAITDLYWCLSRPGHGPGFGNWPGLNAPPQSINVPDEAVLQRYWETLQLAVDKLYTDPNLLKRVVKQRITLSPGINEWPTTDQQSILQSQDSPNFDEFISHLQSEITSCSQNYSEWKAQRKAVGNWCVDRWRALLSSGTVFPAAEAPSSAFDLRLQRALTAEPDGKDRLVTTR